MRQRREGNRNMRDDIAERVFGPRYAGRRYLRTHEVIAIGIAANRRTLANLVKRGDLPTPIRLGRVLLFSTDELAARLARHEQEARCETPPP